ncbi:MAG: UDP-N-acetylglucosamine--N-acetylmuramyl-(pentapeptide) pyrophosphoryl-undecaprenol N-acetylglucosamine transferase, partial [Bacteroidota bacterium]
MAIGRKVKILCAAGGTGGHLFPAVAVAEKISELNDGKAEIHFIGRPDKIEAEVTPKLGYKFHPLKMRGLNKLFSLDTLLMPFNIFRNIVRCKQLIRDEKFDAVICTGAYISYPPGMAASQEKVPLILMESNVNPGKSIRMLSAKADLILTSFEESAKFFEKGTASKIKYTGNPVRKKIQDYSTKKNLPAAFDLDPDKFTVLIFGGSLGAKSINTAIEKNIDKLAALD